MNKKLALSIGIFFILLILFIAVIFISEYRNMNKLKMEYISILEMAYDYRKSRLKIWAINLILKFLFPLLFLTTGLSKRIGVFAEGNGRGPFLTGFLYVIIFFAIDLLFSLPISFYGEFILKHRYDLSNQSILRWLELVLKNFTLNILIFSLIIWFPYYLIYKHPNRWWLYLGLLSIPVIAFITFISPMYIDPIFNKYTSIKDEELGKEIQKLLQKANIEEAQIYKVDKSRDTKEMNAYMTGIFKSKRIVLWDTTIKKLEKDEILSVTAHEIGHYIKGHIWKSIILGGLFSIFLIYLIYRTSNWVLINSNGIFGFSRLYDIASLPLILLILNFYLFLANPIMNLISRHMEREADMIEIELTKNKEAAISTMLKLNESNLSIPRPSKIYEVWYYTHPTTEDRIKFFEDYQYSNR
ncbi:M48 family metallopeptidase [Tepidimicrobium xylanilyticum]|uniref:M48 family metallopeptidase n=1 Tax=Tepidimicrobium xylanilyticum TaxID=1123352 RepID=UPI00295F0A1E|nr:M48 family metallopeptidase [Tepidimicrobium xylanilyticum]